MVDITPLVKEGQQIIQTYGDGFIKISGVRYTGPILVRAHQTCLWDIQPLSHDDKRGDGQIICNNGYTLCAEHFMQVLHNGDVTSKSPSISDVLQGEGDWREDIILFGSGRAGVFIPPSVRSILKEAGVNVEAMDTGAACRTYNVLMTEGRRVTAALIPI